MELVLDSISPRGISRVGHAAIEMEVRGSFDVCLHSATCALRLHSRVGEETVASSMRAPVARDLGLQALQVGGRWELVARIVIFLNTLLVRREESMSRSEVVGQSRVRVVSGSDIEGRVAFYIHEAAQSIEALTHRLICAESRRVGLP